MSTSLRSTVVKAAAKLTAQIEDWPQSDYRWRVRVDGAALGKVYQALQASVTYPNFKSRIAELPGQRAKLGAYGQLWHGLAELQTPA